MMRIFISYAKRDTRELAFQIRDALNALSDVTAWMDESLEPGESWAIQLQEEIDAADYIVVLLSPDVNRPIVGKQDRSFVLNEIDYAQQEDKTIIPVMAQDTRLPVQLAGVQYIDLTHDRAAGIKSLIRNFAEPAELKPVNPSKPVSTRRSYSFFGNPVVIIGFIIFVALILFAVVRPNLNSPPSSVTAVNTNVVLSASELPPTKALTVLAVPTEVPTLIVTPSLEIALVVQTLDANATVEQATSNAQSTYAARVTAYVLGTQMVLDQTATLLRWTATLAPSVTSTPSTTFTSAPSDTSTPKLTSTRSPAVFAGNPILRNTDWQPVYKTFDGVEMVLVPVGCFMMGNENGIEPEIPANKQCFDQPFWIDRYEVTNKQYGSEGFFKGDNRPRDSVTWFEARDYCAKRAARLPTEREWEYAARGPDNLIYPWGNDFENDNVVMVDVGKYYVLETFDVGSRPTGNAWIGASDLSGNLGEWVSSIFQPYPYQADDGREVNDDSTAYSRVLRGGAWDGSADDLRADSRNFYAPDNGDIDDGFRCARDY